MEAAVMPNNVKKRERMMTAYIFDFVSDWIYSMDILSSSLFLTVR